MNVLKKITRLEVIDENGRTVIFNQFSDKEVAISVQDEGRTLKLFVSPRGTTGVENTPSDIPEFNNAPSMALDDLIDDIEEGPDATEFKVDSTKPTMVLEGVPGTDQLSENEA